MSSKSQTKKKQRRVIKELQKVGIVFKGWQHRSHRTNGTPKKKTLVKLKLEKEKDKEFKKLKNKL